MEDFNLISIDSKTKAVVVGVLAETDIDELQREMAELESLLMTLGVPVVATIIQNGNRLSSSHLLGTGKVDEVAALARDKGGNLVVVDHPLSGPQVRNLEKGTNCQVTDRAGVILDIFARHAKTNQARTQVEIAKLEYLLPRLTGAWTHFQRQTGGGVRARGMGEKQIEVDRRRARSRIARLYKRLETIEKEKKTQRSSRQGELKVAVVGYTNSGKTTLMKGLTRATQEGKDELFATLDSATRTIDPNTRPKILLSDTVGFIKNLPHGLIESFKSTLEEVATADLLLHVVDISHPNYQGQMHVTNEVLEDIGAGEIPNIMVFNKSDKLRDEPFLPKILSKAHLGSILVTAIEENDIKELRQHVYDFFEKTFVETELIVPFEDAQGLSLVHQMCVIQNEDYETPGEVRFIVRAPEATIARLSKYDLNAPSKDEDYD